MPLLGSAAMLLSFDIDADAIDEHDRWHTHEHLPERLSIPGFLRGTRWTAVAGSPRYMVLYEVQELATLSSPAYLARLNAPTPWTSRMMTHYRGMRRGLCSVVGTFGHGQGGEAALVRFTSPPGDERRVRDFLLDHALPAIPAMAGMGSAHLLQGTQVATMTNEQRIRGADRGVDSAVVLMGYDAEAVANQAQTVVATALPALPSDAIDLALYRLAYSVSRTELQGEARS